MIKMNEVIMKCAGLWKNYGNVSALRNINCEIKSGRIYGLLGPNGSGKTTLIKIANGLLTPSAGKILINGNEVGLESRKAVSYLPDCVALPDWMRIRELIKFYDDFYEDFSSEKAYRMLESLQLDSEQRFKTLSKGNKEKVQLILVMSREAKLYLLDEPMGGVDPATRDYILNTIITNYSPDAAVVISTHLISDVENILDEVFFINRGEIVLEDTVDNIRGENGKSVDALFREVFRC